MASIMVKFRESSVAEKAGVLYYQVIVDRMVRQLRSDYRIYAHEWDEDANRIVVAADGEREAYLRSVAELVELDMMRWQDVLEWWESKGKRYGASDVVAMFVERTRGVSLRLFVKEVERELQRVGKYRTAEVYEATLRSVMRFNSGRTMFLEDIDAEWVERYEIWMLNRGLRKNSSSFYMRALRAVYNRAVEQGVVEQRRPFKRVYTGIDRTVKRAVDLLTLRKIRRLDLSKDSSMELARDMLLFSFYTRGMSPIDMAYLRKSDLKDGMLTYCRRKTGQRLSVRWERCMAEIVERWEAESHGEYMLPILKRSDNHRNEYRSKMCKINRLLKEIGRLVGMEKPLTMYVARHSWASVARSIEVPLAVISEGMGHDSESTTQIYLASLDSTAVDRANEQILRRCM